MHKKLGFGGEKVNPDSKYLRSEIRHCSRAWTSRFVAGVEAAGVRGGGGGWRGRPDPVPQVPPPATSASDLRREQCPVVNLEVRAREIPIWI